MLRSIKTENNYLEKKMKNTMKVFLALSICCTAALAGDQSNGGRNCGGEGQPPCEPPCCGVAPIGHAPTIMDDIILTISCDTDLLGF
jgi:hypothetical protein